MTDYEIPQYAKDYAYRCGYQDQRTGSYTEIYTSAYINGRNSDHELQALYNRGRQQAASEGYTPPTEGQVAFRRFAIWAIAVVAVIFVLGCINAWTGGPHSSGSSYDEGVHCYYRYSGKYGGC